MPSREQDMASERTHRSEGQVRDEEEVHERNIEKREREEVRNEPGHEDDAA